MGKATASAACSAPEAVASTARPVASATAPVAAPSSPVAVAREGVVEELSVGFDRLPRQLLPGPSLPLCLLGEPFGTGAARLGLLPEVARNELGELAGALLLALCRLGGLPVGEPVGVGEGLGEAPGRLVQISGSSWVRHVFGSFFWGRACSLWPSRLPTPSGGALHAAAGRYARLALPEEGYDLPVHLGSPLDEHQVASAF